MGERADEERLGAVIALAIPLFVGAGLVAVRGELSSSAVALILACTVVVGGRLGGRAGGLGSALMAAVSFDFFHTVPYLSLKIANVDDIVATLALLVVGVLVGSIAGNSTTSRRQMQARYRAAAAVTRVLAIAQNGPALDVELAVRAELIQLLDLDKCWFSTEAVSLPSLDRAGSWTPGAEVAPGGFTLPPQGVTVPVDAQSRRFGMLICIPDSNTGIPTANRQSAYALAEVLGLSLSARASA